MAHIEHSIPQIYSQLNVLSKIHPIENGLLSSDESLLRRMATAVERVDENLWRDVVQGKIGHSTDGALMLVRDEITTKNTVSNLTRELIKLQENYPVVHFSMLYGSVDVLNNLNNAVVYPAKKASIIPVVVRATVGNKVVLPQVVSSIDTKNFKDYTGAVLYTELLDSGASEFAAMVPFLTTKIKNGYDYPKIIQRLKGGFGSDYRNLNNIYALVAEIMREANVVLAVTMSKNTPLLQELRKLSLKHRLQWWGQTQNNLLRSMFVMEFFQDQWLMGAGADTGISLRNLISEMGKNGNRYDLSDYLKPQQEYTVRVGSTLPGIVVNLKSLQEFTKKVAPMFSHVLANQLY